VPDKEKCEAFLRVQKMCWSKTVQRVKPEHGFAEAEPPKGGEAYTDLLCEVPTTLYIYFFH